MTLTRLQKMCRSKTLNALRRATKKIDENLGSCGNADTREVRNKLDIVILLLRNNPSERNVYLGHLVSEKVVLTLAREGIFTVLDVASSDLRALRKILQGNRLEMPIVLRYPHPEK